MKSLLKAAVPVTLLAACLTACKSNEAPVLESLSFAEEGLELNVGDVRQLEVIVNPPDAQGYVLQWTSSDEAVASVNDEGEVTALAAGTADITVSSGEISATCALTVKTTYEYVDLGLSVKWAAYNIGAENPWDYGDYFAYGETKTKEEYTWENSLTYEQLIGNFAGDPEYDAAAANWGGSWRLPTKTEVTELIENCDWEWTEMEGVSGCLVTASNGNSIFLPAAGYYGAELVDAGRYGYYWDCDPDAESTMGNYLSFSSFSHRQDPIGRYWGMPIRPVCE